MLVRVLVVSDSLLEVIPSCLNWFSRVVIPSHPHRYNWIGDALCSQITHVYF
jgi:hypothetical protein